MALLDVLALIDLGDDKKCYKGILRKLKDMAEERGYSFGPPKSEWELDNMPRPRPMQRTSYFIEGSKSGVVGFVFVPDLKRKHRDIGWNQLYDPALSVFRKLEAEGYEGKQVHTVLIQVWPGPFTPIIPLGILEQTAEFISKGWFHVKNNDRGDFVLMRSLKYEGGNLRLDWRLEDVFKFL